MTTNRRRPSFLPAVLFGAIIAALFQLAWWAEWIPQASFPSLAQLWNVAVAEAFSAGFWQHVWATYWIWLVGLALGSAAGVASGLVIGSSSLLRRLIEPTIDAIRPVPMIALLPVAILLLGMGPKLGLILVAFSTYWPIVIHTIYGVAGVDAAAADVARVLRLGRIRTLITVTVPAALPLIVTGVKVAAATGLVVQVGVALIVGGDGLGGAIAAAQIAGAVPRMYLYVLATGFLALVVMAAINVLERRVVFYSHAHRERASV